MSDNSRAIQVTPPNTLPYEATRKGMLFMFGEDGISVKSVTLLQLHGDGTTSRSSEIMLTPSELALMDRSVDAMLESLWRRILAGHAGHIVTPPPDEDPT